MTNEVIKVLLVDNQTLVLQGLEILLNNQKNIKVVGTVSSSKGALKVLNKSADYVDVVIINIDMTLVNGIEITNYIISNSNHIKVLGLSVNNDLASIKKMYKAGANGYVSKEVGISELSQIIHKIYQGGSHYDEKITSTTIETNTTVDFQPNNREAKPTRVLLVEDHELVLQGFKALLKNEESIDVVGTARNGQEALSLIAQNPEGIDVAIVDVIMPVMDGIEATKRITELYPTIKVLAHSMHEEATYIKGMYVAGAKGYVLKGTNMEDIRQAILNVHQGNTYFSEQIMKMLLGPV